MVTNRSLIEFNEVVPFAPFGSESNSSSYLQWAIVLDEISVRPISSCILLEMNSGPEFHDTRVDPDGPQQTQTLIRFFIMQVNGTSLTPEPTYPVQTMNKTIALIDV